MEFILHGLYLGSSRISKSELRCWVSRRDGATLKSDYFTLCAFEEAPPRLDAIDAANPLQVSGAPLFLHRASNTV